MRRIRAPCPRLLAAVDRVRGHARGCRGGTSGTAPWCRRLADIPGANPSCRPFRCFAQAPRRSRAPCNAALPLPASPAPRPRPAARSGPAGQSPARIAGRCGRKLHGHRHGSRSAAVWAPLATARPRETPPPAPSVRQGPARQCGGNGCYPYTRMALIRYMFMLMPPGCRAGPVRASAHGWESGLTTGSTHGLTRASAPRDQRRGGRSG